MGGRGDAVISPCPRVSVSPRPVHRSVRVLKREIRPLGKVSLMRVLAGDIGGTKTVVAIAEIGERHLSIRRFERYLSADFGSLEEILEDFLARERRRDRKSTRLNSSHSSISYAVFCL